LEAQKIKDGLYWVGALNPNLRVFDIIMYTPHGTSYNSYFIKAEKTVLIDTVYRKFTQSLVDRVGSLTEPQDIDYIVANHTEMDHSTALANLLKLAPQATVVSTAAGAKFLKNILNADFKSMIVKDNDTIDLGNKQLKFITVPFWHWPDTMFTYLVEDKTLFTCDGFGSHFCDERLFDDKVDDFSEDFKLYYDVIMRPFRRKIAEGLKKIEDLEIEIIAPSHGPVLRTNPSKYIKLYEEWSHPKEERTVLVFYDSIYGNTRQMAEEIGKGVSAQNMRVKLLEASKINLEKAKEEVEKAEGLMFGSPTINNDAVKPIWDIISTFFDVETKGKKGAAFGSYGWSGEAVKLIEERLKGLHINIPVPGLRVNFTPDQSDVKACFEFGKNFAQTLETGH